MVRSNTVAGGERVAARAMMFQKLRGRVGPPGPTLTGGLGASGQILDSEVNSGTEEVFTMPEILARDRIKRRKRRSHRRSNSATATQNTPTLDELSLSSAQTTPATVHSPLPSETPPPPPSGPAPLEQVDDDDIQQQEEMQMQYYQGPAVRGGIRVLIEEEDDPPPPPVDPNSIQPTGDPDTPFTPPITDRSLKRQTNESTSPSLGSSMDDGLGSRVPVVLVDHYRAHFGRQDAFPISAILTPGKDKPLHYDHNEEDEESVEPASATTNMDDEDANNEDENDAMGNHLRPSPRTWNPKSSDSWIVDSYCEYFVPLEHRS